MIKDNFGKTCINSAFYRNDKMKKIYIYIYIYIYLQCKNQ